MLSLLDALWQIVPKKGSSVRERDETGGGTKWAEGVSASSGSKSNRILNKLHFLIALDISFSEIKRKRGSPG